MKEQLKPVREVTVERENLGVVARDVSNSNELVSPTEFRREARTQMSDISERTTSLKRTQGTT